jgi:hypothetical protein
MTVECKLDAETQSALDEMAHQPPGTICHVDCSVTGCSGTSDLERNESGRGTNFNTKFQCPDGVIRPSLLDATS